MNAAQLRRLEEKLTEAEEFFVEGAPLTSSLEIARDHLRDVLVTVSSERARAELREFRHPFSKRAAL